MGPGGGRRNRFHSTPFIIPAPYLWGGMFSEILGFENSVSASAALRIVHPPIARYSLARFVTLLRVGIELAFRLTHRLLLRCGAQLDRGKVTEFNPGVRSRSSGGSLCRNARTPLYWRNTLNKLRERMDIGARV